MPDTKSNQSNSDSSKPRDIPRGDKGEQKQAEAEDRTSQREDVGDDTRKEKKIQNDLPDVDKRAKDKKTDAINDDASIVREKEASAENAQRKIPSE